MFACFWKMWVWLDPKAMENKKSPLDSQENFLSGGTNEMGPVIKHQYNNTSQHFKIKQQHNDKMPTYANFKSIPHQQLIQQPNTWTPLHVQQQLPNLQNQKQFIHNSTSSTEVQNIPVKPFTPIEDKKKTNSNNQQTKTSNKKPVHGTINMQGWLHKQGSDGLKVWRKRWFILAEYCLYYYKGPEEEKVLGSILLPSYKVSVCSSEDKVNRKYAFKCEHANMRTYFLAADSQQAMMNWFHALTSACILKSNVNSEEQLKPMIPSKSNSSLNNSNSGIHQQYNVHNNVHVHMHSCSNTSGTTMSEYTMNTSPNYGLEFGINNSDGLQPVYANAPPKPRRLVDGGYSSSNSDFSALDHYHMKNNQYNNQNQYSMGNHLLKSPNYPPNLRNCDTNLQIPNNQLQKSAVLAKMHCSHRHDQQMLQQRDYNIGRRTPDTYGRSNLNSDKIMDSADYEDVYADDMLYKRPLSPVAYKNIRTISPVASITIHQPYKPVYISASSRPDFGYSYSNIPQRQQPTENPISRPHSADFLDYEVRHKNMNSLNAANNRPRPKSSLDIRRSPSDNYFYSKETYAENMRKSALYVQNLNPHYHLKDSENLFVVYDKKNYHGPKTYHHFNPNIGREKQQFTDSRGSLDTDLFTRPCSKSPISQFTDDFQCNKEREESMRRLLEWKQRMLQSPLNRKMSPGFTIPHAIVSRSDMNAHVQSSHPYHSTSQVQTPIDNHHEQSDSRLSYLTGPQYNHFLSDDEASGSICMTPHETFPRAMPKKQWPTNSTNPFRPTTLSASNSQDFDKAWSNPYTYNQTAYSEAALSRDSSQQQVNVPRNIQKDETKKDNNRMNMSAGELLGRTHEELVLLLIQLRRQSTNTCHAIEVCYDEIDNIQSKLATMDAKKRLENLQKLEQIKQHLLELEKQYEKDKPLVNLVDNMVKLGSLYRSPSDQQYHANMRGRLEFNQQIQEQRLLAEERRDWNRLSPNHIQLQTKVQQLYQLDRLLQEESRTLQALQNDKEKIEKALGGLRLQIDNGYKDPNIIEQSRKQQLRLENELCRVHYMLAQNSKKLEETVAGNARLEQELLVFRQKLQLAKQHRNSAQFSNIGAGDSLPCAASLNAVLESELHRVQQLVGDLQRQRQELSIQVRQLTDRSQSLSQQIYPSSLSSINSISSSSNSDKRNYTTWKETDLDTMRTVDHGIDFDPQYKSRSISALYMNLNPPKQTFEPYSRPEELTFIDNNQEQNAELSSQEKQEIKTVRIVKRESERRQRDREKNINNLSDSDNYSQLNWDPVTEDQSNKSFSVPSTRNETIINKPTTLDLEHKLTSQLSLSNNLINQREAVSSPSIVNSFDNEIRSNSSDLNLDKSLDLSPVFKSETARQIIMEMSGVHSEPSTLKNSARRINPKEKRRHYTAPHNNLMTKSVSSLPIDSRIISDSRRARDDLDMEQALRQRTETPDVVRSTMSSKELKYNENTIDNILGTPNKIFIPERYIPEQLPQLSAEEQKHRLRKVESIKRMLSDTAIYSAPSTAQSENTNTDSTETKSDVEPSAVAKATSKIVEDKKQREHLLQLNQILAKQVMEMSKIVAVKALENLPLEKENTNQDEEEDLSPITPLPLYQQRNNYYS